MITNSDPKLQERLNKIYQESQERLAKRQAMNGNVGYLDLTKVQIETDALRLLAEEEARRIGVVAFEQRDRAVAIGVKNPTSTDTKTFVQSLVNKGLWPKVFLVSERSLEHAWSFYKYALKEATDITSRLDIAAKKVSELQQELTTLQKVSAAISANLKEREAIGNLLEVVLAGALTNRASDIHFEPQETIGRLRYRIDGVLMDVMSDIPIDGYHLIISRIKLLSGLRLNITNVSQDGRFTIGLGEVAIELRVSVIPSEYGETVVMRILDPRATTVDLHDLGLRSDDLAIIEEQLKAPNGMILNTGPTGSGKTTTLYAFLRRLVSPDIKVITIEDPIEYHLKGIEQTQIDPKAGYTFSNGLQAIMRQDPDVILVGEIRDKDTAGIAVQAALTGHLVFSTLHTNSASGVIPRLLDLEAPITSIGPALNLIIAQRLVRKLCPHCKTPVQLNEKLKTGLEAFLNTLPKRIDQAPYSAMTIFEPNKGGCDQCQGTGFRGRIAVFELLIADEKIEDLIVRHAGEGEIKRFAKAQGMVTFQEDGLLKVLTGITSLSEVESVTGALPF